MFWSRRDHFELRDWWEHIHFQVVTAYDVVGAPNWSIEAPVQPTNELWLVRTGTVETIQNERAARISSGEAALLLEGLPRQTREMDGQPLAIVGFNFHATLLGALPFAELLELPPHLTFQTQRLGELLDEIVKESREKRAGYAMAIHGLAQLAFLEFWRAARPDEDWLQRAQRRWNLLHNSELAGALTLVAAKFDEPLDVATLARAAHLSPKHFARKFRAALGLTPMEYLRRYRLSRARELLGENHSVGHIATRCGWSDAAHFSRAFKAHFGLSPLEFRAQIRQTDARRSPMAKTGPFDSASLP